MATFARTPERAVVHVVLTMAPVTIRCQCDLGDIPRGMADVAIEAAMSAGQWIACLFIVIEPPSRPTVWIMAKPAVRP